MVPPAPPSAALSALPLAGRYVLLDPVGSGGMGEVWRAHDSRTHRDVALKILTLRGGAHLLRFVREQSVRVQHPHVVAPTGWAAEDDLVLLTMDLVAGGSVATLLGDHGPLPESYVAVLLDQLLQALAAVHAAGVVHRDVTPANLLLEVTGTGRPHLRLADFGIAALVDDARLTPAPGPIGTPAYASPEQSTGAAPDPRHDLWSVGVVATTLLTGSVVGRPTGRLAPLVAALTDPDLARRPSSAAVALAHLRRIGVPPGAPWRTDPDPPEVFDQLARSHSQPPGDLRVAAAERSDTLVAIVCFVLAIALSVAALVQLR